MIKVSEILQVSKGQWCDWKLLFSMSQSIRVDSIKLKWRGTKTDSGTNRPLWPCPVSQIPPTPFPFPNSQGFNFSWAQHHQSMPQRYLQMTHVTVSSLLSLWLTQIYCFHLPVAHGASRANRYVPAMFRGVAPLSSWPCSCGNCLCAATSGHLAQEVMQPHETSYGHWAPRSGQHVKAPHSPAGCLKRVFSSWWN